MAALSRAMFAGAYAGKRVFVTGHTGFKGAWLSLWLARLGARVTGFALPPPTQPSLFEAAGVEAELIHVTGDIRDPQALEAALAEARPDFIFHLAAQPLVLDSYAAPTETFAVNCTGTIHLLEAIRRTGTRAAVVVVATDKVYRNEETGHPFCEDDPLGGYDPYGASKAAMEIATACWRDSFFAPARIAEHGVRLASARAGNVIGGGDWSANRIVPDLVRARAEARVPKLRHPRALRPWQHVLEPLAGYLQLGARLASDAGARFARPWNFGPEPIDTRSVATLAETVLAHWGSRGWRAVADPAAPHEAATLRLAIDRAVSELGWRPLWSFAESARRTANWYADVADGRVSARAACDADLDAFAADAVACFVGFAA